MEQYEMLRAAALGEPLAVEARAGLALFLRRGMWAWARAAAVPRHASRPAQLRLPTSTTDNEQRVIVRLFAAMAMRSKHVRTHERFAQSPVASSGA